MVVSDWRLNKVESAARPEELSIKVNKNVKPIVSVLVNGYVVMFWAGSAVVYVIGGIGMVDGTIVPEAVVIILILR